MIFHKRMRNLEILNCTKYSSILCVQYTMFNKLFFTFYVNGFLLLYDLKFTTHVTSHDKKKQIKGPECYSKNL